MLYLPAPMLHVSLLVEALRARPVLMFWVAALSQAVLWVLLPTLIYAAPPADVPLVLATDHEWLLGSPAGPPLAHWVRENPLRRLRPPHARRLSALADLRGRHLLGRVRARPRHRRRAPRGHGGAAHGGRYRVHGADPRLRPGGAGDGGARA